MEEITQKQNNITKPGNPNWRPGVVPEGAKPWQRGTGFISYG
jgi:hypothetical protein